MVYKNGLAHMEPLLSTGDGNCLFNSISFLICGSEELSILLRALSFIYAVVNLERVEQWVCKYYPF